MGMLDSMGLKVIGQTNFTQPSTWYDQNAPVAPSAMKQWAMDVFKPVVQIQDANGNVVYKSGDFYEPTGQYWIAGLAVALGIGALILISHNRKKRVK